MSDPNQQTRKRQIILIVSAIGGILGLAVAGAFMFDPAPPVARKEKPKTVNITAPGNIDDKDAWRAQQASKEKTNEALIGELRAKVQVQDDEFRKFVKNQDELKAKAAAGQGSVNDRANQMVLSTPLPLTATTGNPPLAGQRVLLPPGGKSMPDSAGILNKPLNAVPEIPARELEIIRFNTRDAKPVLSGGAVGGTQELQGFPTDEKAKKFATTSATGTAKTEPIQFLPAGSFIRVAMLNGMDAPTGGQAQSNPLPLALHVVDIANLANKHRLDIRDCRVIAAGWGDLSSERMMARSETLTCILNGEAIEAPIKGQLIGEDGKAGVRGRLVTKQGQILANALLAGGLSSIGKAFQQSSTVSTTGAAGISETVDPGKVGQAALGGGIGSAGQMLAQYYLKAADKLFPVIETDGGRVVELMITKGVVLNLAGASRDEFRGLMKRGISSAANSRKDEDD